MSICGTVLVDLRDVPRDRQRHRADALRLAPDGARVVVVVGALAVEPGAVRVLVEHGARLDVLEVQGEPGAVLEWVNALRFDPTLPAVSGTS